MLKTITLAVTVMASALALASGTVPASAATKSGWTVQQLDDLRRQDNGNDHYYTNKYFLELGN